MKKLCFKVKALSNLVIKASSNNEGNMRYLDYLPGNVFLGIVAKIFDKFENPFEVFFKKVKFLDANPLNGENITYKIPLSFYHEKLNTEKIYNFHFLTKDDFNKNGKLQQFKQIRNEYIDKNLNKKEVKFSYNQKSAIDYKKGRSKESQMFGYKSIDKGEKFYFEILIDDISNNDIELIKTSLIGEKRVGKSKSAEYAKVLIEEVDEKPKINSISNDKTYIYFKSRAVLFDDEGNPTYDVKYAFDEKYRDKIDYEKSNIRTYSYMPYNFVRDSFDSERFCIEKGSVVVLNTKIDNLDFVGAFNNEGFGEVILNPEFLTKKEIQFNNKSNNSKNNENIETNLSKFLTNRKNQMQEEIQIVKEVEEFKENNKIKVSNSQWGNIRNIAKSFDNFKEEIENFISHGTKKWSQKDINTLISYIENSVNPKKFTILLASEMAKDKK